MTRSCRNMLMLAMLVVNVGGCASLRHELQPHRLRRFNRGAAPSLSPDFTQSGSSKSVKLVRLDRSGVSANSAVSMVARVEPDPLSF